MEKEIYVNGPDTWSVTKDGHAHTDINAVTRYESNGGIGSAKDNGSRAFVQTYHHDEVTIDLLDRNKQITKQHIRLRLGTNDGQHIIVLENGNFYIVGAFATVVKPENEIAPEKIFMGLDLYDKLNRKVGSTLELKTREKFSIVQAINELAQRSSTPRKLAGYIKYLSDGVNPENVKDLEVRYNHELKRFQYYSDVGEWVLLPVGWQKLNNLVRAREYLPTTVLEGTTYGILEEDEVVRYENRVWTKYCIPTDEVGDEYIVQFVYNDAYKGNATGSVINTPMGWVYLVNYTY